MICTGTPSLVHLEEELFGVPFFMVLQLVSKEHPEMGDPGFKLRSGRRSFLLSGFHALDFQEDSDLIRVGNELCSNAAFVAGRVG